MSGMQDHTHGQSGAMGAGGQSGATGAGSGQQGAMGATGAGGSQQGGSGAGGNGMSGNGGMSGGGAGGAAMAGGRAGDRLTAAAVEVPTYMATLTALNGSGVAGTVTATIADDRLTVRVEASGLEPNQTHIQHIHGRLDDAGLPADSTTPTQADDADGDGFVELAEGLPDYGPILVNVSSPPGSGTEGFPTAPTGAIVFEETYDLDDSRIFGMGMDAADIGPLDLREFVIHGLTVDGSAGAGTPGEVDGTPGFKLVLPVASGEFALMDGSAVPAGTTLNGFAGADTLMGAAGADSLNGGQDDDSLEGGDGADVLRGGQGDDALRGDAGADLLAGGQGMDDLHGGSGADSLEGNSGDDSVCGDAGADMLAGGSGNDTLSGDTGGDMLMGNSGNDMLMGDDGGTTAAGADLGGDTLDGGAGNDTLSGGDGIDSLTGGSGADSFMLKFVKPVAPPAAGATTPTSPGFAAIGDFNAAEDTLVFDAMGVGEDAAGAGFTAAAAGAAGSFHSGAAADADGESVVVITDQDFASAALAAAAVEGEEAGDLIVYYNTTVGVGSLLYVSAPDTVGSIARFTDVASLEDLQAKAFTADDFQFM